MDAQREGTLDSTDVVTQQPRRFPTDTPDNASLDERGRPESRGEYSCYSNVDSPAHRPSCSGGRGRSPCPCCAALWCRGRDPRWFYPWDKGPCGVASLCLMWYAVCLVFPCSLCIPWCRDIICLVDEHCWDGTCFGACICGIPLVKKSGRGRVSTASSPAPSCTDLPHAGKE